MEWEDLDTRLPLAARAIVTAVIGPDAVGPDAVSSATLSCKTKSCD